MRHRHTVIVALISAAAVAVVGGLAHGESNGPPTLMRWSYGSPPSDDKSPLDEPLEADRPDFTESPKTVGKGVVQLEMGYTFTSDSSGGVRTGDHSFPETLLRVGVLADWLEFRAEWNYEIERTRQGGVSQTDSGADDLIVGFKIALTQQQGCLPETGIILDLSIPTGSNAFTTGAVQPGVNYCYSWELMKDWSLSGSTSVGGAADDVTNDPYTEFTQSLSLGHTFNEKLDGFSEFYVLSPISADTNRPQDYYNAGFAVHINKDVQWDIRAGVGLNEAADNYFAGTGLTLRFY
jgi:Putative MetA-pathway of phenol degradation